MALSRLDQYETHNSRSNSRSDSRNCREPTRKIFICPCILGAFFQELGWSPRTREISTKKTLAACSLEAQQRYFSYRAMLAAIVSQNFFVLVFMGCLAKSLARYRIGKRPHKQNRAKIPPKYRKCIFGVFLMYFWAILRVAVFFPIL